MERLRWTLFLYRCQGWQKDVQDFQETGIEISGEENFFAGNFGLATQQSYHHGQSYRKEQAAGQKFYLDSFWGKAQRQPYLVHNRARRADFGVRILFFLGFSNFCVKIYKKYK